MGADGTVEMAYDYQYDGWNRLSVVSANGQALASYQYNDALGLVTVERHLGETVGACPQATVSTQQYSYDDRDRLTSMTSDLFDEYLYYDSQHPQTATDNFIVSASNNYNGNINALKAVYKFNNTTNASTLNMAFSQPTIYGYRYDSLNRLTSADASVMENLVSAGPATPARLYGDENYTYDRIGNIKKLNRYLYNSPASVTAGATNEADSWTYGYTTGTNKLSRIDQIGEVLSALIGQYTYDQNGNVRTDTKRSVNQTTYGRANLPTLMTIDNKTATYLYGVDDNRLYKKRLNNSSSTVEDEAYYLKDAAGRDVAILNLLNSTTDYYVYGKQRIAKLQGGSTQYYTTDHLGNTRVTYTATANCVPPLNNNPPILTVQQTVLNVNDYFPYGKILRSYVSSSDEKFGYQNSERELEISNNDYYTLFRGLDAETGRWKQVDPKWSQSWSPYASMNCNPILYNDPLGDIVEYENFGDRLRVGIRRIFDSDFRSRFNNWKADESNTYTFRHSSDSPDLGQARSSMGPPSFSGGNNQWNVRYSNVGHFEQKGIEALGTRTLTIGDNNSNNSTSTQELKRVVPGSQVIISPLPHPDQFTFTNQNGAQVFQGTFVRGNAGDNYATMPGLAPVTTLTVGVTGSTTTTNFTIPNGTTSLTLNQNTTNPWPYTTASGNSAVSNFPNSQWNVTYTRYRLSLPVLR
ncbi:MAG: hypothetical protein HYU69_12375 [Bacteroidetes bacterium]|nr:hypothetical protein [Bacteroidota bacterium]